MIQKNVNVLYTEVLVLLTSRNSLGERDFAGYSRAVITLM